MSAAAPSISVHPLVLLNIADHVTRYHLHHGHHGSIAAPPASFLPTVGVLMGHGPTTLTTSFEVPLRRNDMGDTVVTRAVGGAAVLVQTLLRHVDWAAARQHREQLDAVLPECVVVGGYVVVEGERVGGPGSEGSADVASVVRCLTSELQQATLLPTGSDGFVVLVVYDGEVTMSAQHEDSSSSSSGVRRLPFDTLWVCTAARDDDAAPAVLAERDPTADSGDDGQFAHEPIHKVPKAHTVPAAVSPADMEWIGLANEAHRSRQGTSAPLAHPSPPHTSPTTPSTGKPGFLRRCSAALLSATTTPADAPMIATALPTHTRTDTTAAAASASAGVASAQSCGAAESLLGSLRLLHRALGAASSTASAGDGGTAELLRAVATCVRNTPSQNIPCETADTAVDTASRAESPQTPSADLVRAVLALETQCALQLSRLQAEQRSIVFSRVTAMSGVDSRGLPVPAPSSLSLSSTAAAAARRLPMRGRAADVSGATEDAAAAAAVAESFTPFAVRRDGRGGDALPIVLRGHVWDAK